IHTELLTTHIQNVGMILVVPRERSNSVRAEEFILIEHLAQHPPEAVGIHERKNLLSVHSVMVRTGWMDAGSNFRQSQQSLEDALNQLWCLFPDIFLYHCCGAEGKESNNGAYFQPVGRAIGQAKQVVIEAVFLIPKACVSDLVQR